MPANNCNVKGKGRAVEQSPLLDEHGHENEEVCSDSELPQHSGRPQSGLSRLPMRRVWQSHLLTASLVLLTLFFAFILGIVLLTDSYAAPALHTINQVLSKPDGDSDDFWKEALLLHGPEAVKVADIHQQEDDSGVKQLEVNVSLTLKLAVDTDFIMGFRQVDPDSDGWWTRKWKDLGRWGVRRLGAVTLLVDKITVFPSSPSAPLLVLEPLLPITVPLSPGLSAKDHVDPPTSITSITIPLLIRPSHNASLLLRFAKESWAQGVAGMQLHTSSLLAHGGHASSGPPKWWQLGRWRSWIKVQRNMVTLDLRLPIPQIHIPSHPPNSPGSDLPALSDLLTLESFSIISAPSSTTSQQPFPSATQTSSSSVSLKYLHDSQYTYLSRSQTPLAESKSLPPSMDTLTPHPSQISPAAWNLLISALAFLPHPFSDLGPKLDLRHAVRTVPLIVSLPIPSAESLFTSAPPLYVSQNQQTSDLIPVAQVYGSPTINTTHIRIPLAGFVIPFTNLSSSRVPDAIASFVSSYLSYKSQPIAISTPLYPSLELRATFPPPPERLELLSDLKIENMRIHPGLGSILAPPELRKELNSPLETSLTTLSILASATIHARVTLPAGMKIDIRVAHVWIDCLIFDGKAPPEDGVQEGPYTEDEPDTDPEDTYDSSSPDPAAVLPVPKRRPLPYPFPVRAFARITPKTWFNSTSVIVPPKEQPILDMSSSETSEVANNTGTNILVTAEMVDVPLEMLPGRQGDLSRFVTKVLFSRDPVIAGIRGVAAVGVSVPGLTALTSVGKRTEESELVLTGLPFEGTMRVGGRNR